MRRGLDAFRFFGCYHPSLVGAINSRPGRKMSSEVTARATEEEPTNYLLYSDETLVIHVRRQKIRADVQQQSSDHMTLYVDVAIGHCLHYCTAALRTIYIEVSVRVLHYWIVLVNAPTLVLETMTIEFVVWHITCTPLFRPRSHARTYCY